MAELAEKSGAHQNQWFYVSVLAVHKSASSQTFLSDIPPQINLDLPLSTKLNCVCLRLLPSVFLL